MIPTEPIGSIPRPAELIHGIEAFSAGRISRSDLDVLYHSAIRNTIERFEATGSPVITDGEQGKESFVTYPLRGWRIWRRTGCQFRLRMDTFGTCLD